MILKIYYGGYKNNTDVPKLNLSMNKIVLSTTYFPNIQYISKFMLADKIIIDIYEHYSRQSYRNRCYILSANGLLPLSVPVKKNNNNFSKDILIDYTTNWQKNHQIAIMSAYKNSPYYIFFIDDFSFVFDKKEKFLIDLNLKILEKILKILNIKTSYEFSNDFIKDTENNFRATIHPKPQQNQSDNDFKIKPYYQVFSEKFNFQPNLSILDLLFMKGKESICFL